MSSPRYPLCSKSCIFTCRSLFVEGWILFPFDVRRMISTESPHYRGSFFLCLGALFMVLGGLTNLSLQLSFLSMGSFLNHYFAWSLWIVSLLLLGTGFLWVGNVPGFTRLGMLVAVFHVAQALGILLLILPSGLGPFPPEFLTIGRLVTLLLFIFREKSILPPAVLALLGSATTLQILKINLRILQLLPDGSPTWLALLDTALLVMMAGSLYLLGIFLGKEEAYWPVADEIEETMELEDFNNPEHPWNKNSGSEN